jgi:hypothetical protein
LPRHGAGIENTDFTHPPAAHVSRQHLLDDDLAGAFRSVDVVMGARRCSLIRQSCDPAQVRRHCHHPRPCA